MSKFSDLQKKISANIEQSTKVATQHSDAVLSQFDGFQHYSDSRLETLEMRMITPNPHQPRIEFKEEELEHLTNSIKELGLLQPIIVRKIGLNRYHIVAGERRFRACERLGKTKIDCVVVNITDEENALLALAENITRANLEDYEIAKGIISFNKNYPNKKEYAELLNIGRAKLYRLLSYEALPQSVISRLDTKPGLLPDYAAQQMKSLTNIGYSMEVLEPHIHAAMDLVEKNELKHSKILNFVETRLKSNLVKKSSTKGVRKDLVRSDGSSYGKIKEDGKNFTIQIKLDELSQNNKQKLEEFLQEMMG